MRPDLAVSKFINNIKAGKTIEIYGDGTSARDFVYVDDVVDAISKALERSFHFKIINIGSSSPVTINSLIRSLEKFIGKKAAKKYSSFHKEDMRITYADIKMANKLLGWKPVMDFATGLIKTVETVEF